jgi:hypothetical protein
MCVRSVGLDDAPYAKVLRYVRLLTISTHNDERNWVGNRVLILWIDISHGPTKPNIRQRLPQDLPALYLPR